MTNAELIHHARNYQNDPMDLLFADRLEESEAKVCWIPVSERMPTDGELVDGWNEHIGCRWSDLLYKDGEFRQPANRHGVTHHQGTTLSHYQGEGVAIVMPTHWQRIQTPEDN